MRVGKLSGAVGTYSAADPEVERVACERLGLEPAPSSTQILQRDRHAEVLNALALLAASLERFALEIRHLARTEVREVRGAVRQRPEGLVGDAAQAEPDRLRADLRAGARRPRHTRSSGSRTSRSGTSGTSRTPRPSGSSCPTRSSPSTTCSTASPGCWKGSSSAPSGCARTSTRATGCTSASACCSRSSRRGSRATTRTGSCSATRCARGTRASTSPSSSAPTPRSPARVDLDAVFDLGAYTRHVDVVFDRLRALRRGARPCLRPPSISASGKVRELYALDDERLLLVASDRISTFDVILPTEIPDKGRVLTGLSAFWFARTREHRPESPARAPRATAARSSAGGSRCSRSSSSCAAISPAPAGRTTSSTGAVCGHALPARPARVRSAAGADRHAGDEGAVRATTRTSTRAPRPSSSAPSAGPRSESVALALYALRRRARRGARDHPRRHEVRARARPRRRRSCSATRR